MHSESGYQLTGTMTTRNNGASANVDSSESEVELMRMILGENVPQSVILTCLNACAFDVTAALNWYFMEAASREVETTNEEVIEIHSSVPFIQSGLSLTLHSRNYMGMISKAETFHATLTRGTPSYDIITPTNERFMSIRIWKRNWRIETNKRSLPNIHRPSFMNGDVVSLESNGLWLKASSVSKMLQWKSPSEDDRCKFVIRGLPLGRNLRPGDYFFLTSFKWPDKEIVLKEEKPVGLTSYNTAIHRCFLGLDRVKK